MDVLVGIARRNGSYLQPYLTKSVVRREMLSQSIEIEDAIPSCLKKYLVLA